MRTRTLLAAAIVASLVVPAPGHAAASADLEAYRGLGAWVDIYDPGAWNRPGRVVRGLAARGVRTLYLETANYHTRRAIFRPKATSRFLEAAHARGMRVVGWYLPGFRDLRRDLRRSMAAIRFRSANGHRFDSFALDIEASIVKNAARRTQRTLLLSRRIRQRVGNGYPLGAIIPSPRGMERLPRYWPGFPYARLAAIYDVFVPMTYYSWRAKGPAAVTAYMRRSIDILRERTGIPNVPIHAIGGEADTSSYAEGLAYARVVREYGLLGGSMYDNALMKPNDWSAIARIQPNPVQTPAMPFAFGAQTGEYGNVPGSDTSHPDEVVYRTGPVSGDVTLTVEGYDLGAGEVTLEVNWVPVGTLAEGVPGAWSLPQAIAVPASALRSDGANVFSFVPSTRPAWPVWGVRNVQLGTGP